MVDKHIIIYADDDLDDHVLLKDYFFEMSVKVLPASDGKDALGIINELQSVNINPCLVILDMRMPFLNGKETLMKLKNEESMKHIPVLLFSNYIDPEDEVFVKKYDAEIVIKPHNYEELESTAKLILHKCAIAQKN